MPDPSHQAKRLMDAAVVNGPFTYQGWNCYLKAQGYDTTLELARDHNTTDYGELPGTSLPQEDYNDPADTQTVDEWIRQHDRYK